MFPKLISSSGNCPEQESRVDSKAYPVCKSYMILGDPEEIFVETPDERMTLGALFSRYLFSEGHGDLIREAITFFEQWLSEESPEVDFAKVLKLHDPETEPGSYQGDPDGTFRNRIFFRLGTLANELRVEKVLRALTHPKNVPPVFEMCSIIFAASHSIEFKSYNECESYIKSLEIASCISAHDRLINECSLKIIKLMYVGKHPVFESLDWLFISIIKANDLEKLVSLFFIIPKEKYLKSKMMIAACLYGSFNLLDYLYKLNDEQLSQLSIQECANKSSCVKTLKWVHKNLRVLPNYEGVKDSCIKGRLSVINYVKSFEPNLLNDLRLAKEAALHNQVELVKWFIREFPALIDPENIVDIQTPRKVLELLKSEFKISSSVFTASQLLLAIRLDKLDYIDYAIKFNRAVVQKLSEYKDFEDSINVAIGHGRLDVLRLIDGVVKLDFSCHLQTALEKGQIDIAKWMIQKIENIQKPISDMDLVEYISKKRNAFASFKVEDSGFLNVVSSGNLAVIEYLIREFKELKLQNYMDTAIINGHLELVRRYFDPGRLPFAGSLSTALAKGYFELVQHILEDKRITDREWKCKVRDSLLSNAGSKSIPYLQIERIKQIIKDNEW